MESSDASCTKANKPMVRKRSMGRTGNRSENQSRMQSLENNNRADLESRDAKVYDTSIVKLLGNENGFDSRNKANIGGAQQIQNKRISSRCVLRGGGNEQNRKQEQANKVVNHCYTSLSKSFSTECANNEASQGSKDENGKT